MSRENHAAVDVRLTVRTEGPHVHFRIARLSTMEGALEVARFDKEVLADDRELAEALMGLFSIWLQNQIRQRTGLTLRMVHCEPPEPPDGHA